MENFEGKIREAIRNSVAEQNRSLHVPQNPMRVHRSYWGWVATPVAAVIGIVFGMSFQLMTEDADDTFADVIDTIRITEFQKDTVYLTKVEKENICKHDTIFVSMPAKDSLYRPNLTVPLEEEPQCTSIQCDGINYSLLVVN